LNQNLSSSARGHFKNNGLYHRKSLCLNRSQYNSKGFGAGKGAILTRPAIIPKSLARNVKPA
jgi:hypothetical protein